MADAVENMVRVTLDGRDIPIEMARLGLTMDSSERDIIAAVKPIIREEQGADLDDEYGEVAYAVRKALNSGVIYVYPKPVAG